MGGTPAEKDGSTGPASLRAGRVPALAEIKGLVHGFEQLPLARNESALAIERGGLSGPPRPPAPAAHDENRRRVAAALAPAGRLFFLKQVHGARVYHAPWPGQPEADAGLAEGPGLIVGIETADCLPVLLVDPVRRTVAAAHAGWRGTAAGIVRAAIAALVRHGSRPADLVAATGPGIGPCCYEVGDELRAAFGAEGADFFRPGPRGRPHLDVRAANERQLREAGVPDERIHRLDDCTRCRPDLYHSYRRDGPGAGRMINYIGFSAENAE